MVGELIIYSVNMHSGYKNLLKKTKTKKHYSCLCDILVIGVTTMEAVSGRNLGLEFLDSFLILFFNRLVPFWDFCCLIAFLFICFTCTKTLALLPNV